MVEIEQILASERERLNKLEAPPELEIRLRNALGERKKTKKNIPMVAAILICFLLFSYNYDVIAYYGKIILGYDEVMNGALKDLNEQGQGQEINKRYNFKNGAVLILDGIMLDENRLIVFHTLESTVGNVDDYNLFLSMKGMLRYYSQGGHGKSNEEFTKVKWVYDFEPPYFFERNLTLNFDLSGPNQFQESGSIEFKLDRTKAMGYSIKQNIDRELELKDTIIRFETITASPTQTVINGSIGTALEFLNNVLQNRYYRFGLEYDLIANGQIVGRQGGGMSTSTKGIEFEGRFDPLPQDLEELAIKFNTVTESESVDIAIDLERNEQDKSIEIEGNEIIVNKVYTQNDKTYVTITTQDHVLLEKVYLVVDGEQISLEKTIPGEEEKSLDAKIYYQRKLEFLATGEKHKLLIKKIRYKKQFNEIIKIPLN
ncbi:MAG: hypothetical protein CVU87_00520 [Firmicutes bacterium HGW-Firmicutes-12]|nr:MAG: hypothetical protein CVU87_00520 [Firmicutes bacterium HGW-Firmicutes-12]